MELPAFQSHAQKSEYVYNKMIKWIWMNIFNKRDSRKTILITPINSELLNCCSCFQNLCDVATHTGKMTKWWLEIPAFPFCLLFSEREGNDVIKKNQLQRMFFGRGNLFGRPDLELSDITGIWEKTAFCPFPVKHCLHSDGDLEGHSVMFSFCFVIWGL